jgi:hypothetical protein
MPHLSDLEYDQYAIRLCYDALDAFLRQHDLVSKNSARHVEKLAMFAELITKLASKALRGAAYLVIAFF